MNKIKNFLTEHTLQDRSSALYFNRHQSLSGENIKPNSFFESLKEYFKGRPKLYRFLTKLLSPAYCGISPLDVCENIPPSHWILNLGSGNSNYTTNCINLDIVPYANVHVICEMESLPFSNQSFNAVLSISSLNESTKLDSTLSEIHRVLKSNGTFYCYLPFIQGVLGRNDRIRLTELGIKEALAPYFNEVNIRAVGPTSALNWVAQCYLATITSFNSNKIYQLSYLFFLVLLAPLKFLDIIFNRFSETNYIPSGYWIIAKSA